MKCVNADCSIIEYEHEDLCPVCHHNEEGQDLSADCAEEEWQRHCDGQEAELYEDMAHGGKQDDWHESHRSSLDGDPIEYRDNGEPIGYC